jgi:hypothetical protein
VLREEVGELARALYPRHVAVEVEAVDRLDLEGDVIAE